MVIAEMIAAGDLARLTRPGLELDLTRPVTLRRALVQRRHRPRPCRAARAAHRRHQPLQRGQRRRNAARLEAGARLAAALDRRHAVAPRGRLRGRAPRRARSLPHVRQRPAAGCGGCEEAVRNGLTAEAAVEKVQSDMRARMLHMTDPYLRERMSDFDDLANRLLRQLMGRGAGRHRRRRCRRTRSSSRAPWAPPNCSTIRATSCAGWCWRTARSPAMW